MKGKRNQHEWGLIGQTKNPYHEYSYCELCEQYRIDSSKPFSRSEFILQLDSLRGTNPIYQPDSNELMQ